MDYRKAGVIGAAAMLLAGCGDRGEAPKAASAGGAGKPAAATETILDAASRPKRKPGFWEQTMTTGDMTQVSRLCLDAAAEEKLSIWGQGMTKDMCRQVDMRRRLDGSIAFSSTCDMGGGGRTTSKGVITGDFNSAYRMSIDSVTEGASMAQMNGAHKMTMDAVWKGACPAGYKPGDMEVNGMKFNVAAMGAAPK